VGSITGNAGTVTNGVVTTESYANPSWLTSLAWSKVTGTPTTIAGYGITNAYTKTEVDASLATKQAADTELTTLAGMSSNRAAFLASNEGFGFRNRIINGDMRIDQRNAGASITPIDGQFSVDRWRCGFTAASKFSIQQNAGAVTPPAGFTNYLGITSLSSYSVGVSDGFDVDQQIEGFNAADLGWGTASAQTVTLSFWVRSSLTGTFGGALMNSGYNRRYVFSYTINSANTWEQKTITVSGDTSGTWLTNNGIGIRVIMAFAAGTNNQASPGSWGSSFAIAPTGATSVVGTSGATFYITGVQLEAGSVASPFERIDYGRQLIQCQRYCLVYWNSSGGPVRFFGFNFTTTTALAQIYFPIQTRTQPTGISVSTASGFTLYSAGASFVPSAISLDNASNKTANLSVTATGLTQGGGCILGFQASGNKLELTGMEL
jgi:hypothetical protein